MPPRVSPDDAKLDQAERFTVCQPGPLQALFERVGLEGVTVRAIDVPAVFRNFEDYWTPILGRTGAAPSYLASVGDDVRERIRLRLQSRLASAEDGPIELTARAWAVKGIVGCCEYRIASTSWARRGAGPARSRRSWPGDTATVT
jgi:hypothetical protein